MSRGTWTKIRQSNRFYIDTYRRGTTALLVSITLNVFLGMAVYHSYFNQPEPDFYATDGVTPPVLLTSMDQPNNSSNALLANDQNDYDNTKAVPQ